MLYSIPVACKFWKAIGAIAVTVSIAACGGGGDGGSTATGSGGGQTQAEGLIPVNSEYEIKITGSTAPGGAVSAIADLVVRPTVATSSTPSTNGVNPVEIGIFTKSSPVEGNAGALWLGTNTSLASFKGSNLGVANIDVAFVDAKQNEGTIAISVDGNALGMPNARFDTLNVYNVATGSPVQIHSILTGAVNIRFLNGGQNITGEITLAGFPGFNGSAIPSNYQATFTGTRTK
jgi:hypothetical protein